jgi:fructokinase
VKRVLAFGEALIDFLAAEARPEGPLIIRTYHRYPGGAPANVAVAVARLGGAAAFAGQVGHDAFGDFLVDALARYGVSTALVRRHPSAKTALAFVTLDAGGERSFSFYRDATADLLFPIEAIADAWFRDRPIVHVCSNTLATADSEAATLAVMERARAAGCLTSFDVNLRANLWPAGRDPSAPIWRGVERADLLKVSREELEFLARGASPADAVPRILAAAPRWLVITDGPKPIAHYTAHRVERVEPPAVSAVDTTAAGDAFAGGLLFALARREVDAAAFGAVLAAPDELAAIVTFAARCGALAATRPGAFPSLPTLAEVEAFASARPM